MYINIILIFATMLVVNAEETKKTEESLEEKRVQLRAKEIKARKELEKAQAELRKLDTSEMKKARKEIKKEDESQNIWVRTETQSKLSGCQVGSVSIDPVILGGRFSSPYNMVRITVVNATAVAITIRMSDVRRSGEVVKNLCPNGKVDIVRRIDALDPNYVQGQLVVYPTDASSGAWVDTQSYSVGWSYADTRIWVIHR